MNGTGWAEYCEMPWKLTADAVWWFVSSRLSWLRGIIRFSMIIEKLCVSGLFLEVIELQSGLVSAIVLIKVSHSGERYWLRGRAVQDAKLCRSNNLVCKEGFSQS